MYKMNTLRGLWITSHNVPGQAAGIVIGHLRDPLALGIACGQHCPRVQIRQAHHLFKCRQGPSSSLTEKAFNHGPHVSRPLAPHKVVRLDAVASRAVKKKQAAGSLG